MAFNKQQRIEYNENKIIEEKIVISVNEQEIKNLQNKLKSVEPSEQRQIEDKIISMKAEIKHSKDIIVYCNETLGMLKGG